MQSITYDLNSEQINVMAIIEEIEEICNDSLFVRQIRLWIFSLKLKRIVNQALKQNKKVIQNLYKYDFQLLKKIESKNNEIIHKLYEMSPTCQAYNYEKCKHIFFNNFYNPLTNSFEETLKVINNSYHFDASQIFESDEDFKEHNNALKDFADIWDYESSNEDMEFVFKHNVEKHKV